MLNILSRQLSVTKPRVTFIPRDKAQIPKILITLRKQTIALDRQVFKKYRLQEQLQDFTPVKGKNHSLDCKSDKTNNEMKTKKYSWISVLFFQYTLPDKYFQFLICVT